MIDSLSRLFLDRPTQEGAWRRQTISSPSWSDSTHRLSKFY